MRSPKYLLELPYFPRIFQPTETMDMIVSEKYLGVAKFGDGELFILMGRTHRWEPDPAVDFNRELVTAWNNKNIFKLICLYDSEWNNPRSIYPSWEKRFIESAIMERVEVGDSAVWKDAVFGRYFHKFTEYLKPKKIVLIGNFAGYVNFSDKFNVIKKIALPPTRASSHLEEIVSELAPLREEGDLICLVGCGPAGKVVVSRLVTLGIRCVDVGSVFNSLYNPVNTWHRRAIATDGINDYLASCIS